MPILIDTCSSCGVNIRTLRGATSFKCPGCGEHALGRCPQCRDQSVVYTCEECGFKGP